MTARVNLAQIDGGGGRPAGANVKKNPAPFNWAGFSDRYSGSAVRLSAAPIAREQLIQLVKGVEAMNFGLAYDANLGDLVRIVKAETTARSASHAIAGTVAMVGGVGDGIRRY